MPGPAPANRRSRSTSRKARPRAPPVVAIEFETLQKDQQAKDVGVARLGHAELLLLRVPKLGRRALHRAVDRRPPADWSGRLS